MIRAIPASVLTTLFLLAVYLLCGFRTFNGLSLLIGLSVLWMGWAVWAHLDREVRSARDDYAAALAALKQDRVEGTSR